MGLAASQARLLSITTRLSDNELRSQTITNARTALSTQTNKASKEYLAALDETELYFSTYDSDGNKVTTLLTAACLSEYSTLKNQYGIVNTDGQIMVSEVDANNYLNSATLGEFLEKYGVATVEDQEVDNPEYVQQAIYLYGSDWADFVDEEGEYAAGGLYALEPMPEDYNKVEWVETYEVDDSLYEVFREASESCYNHATAGDAGCYLHVLAHLLDLNVDSNGNPVSESYPKTYTTTYGNEISITSGKISGSAIHSAGMSDDMMPVSDAVCNGVNGNEYYAAEDLDDLANYLDLENQDLTENELLAQQLLSNYYTDENGDVQLKTLKQKIIDLYYVVENRSSLGVSYTDTLLPALERFQKDMELTIQGKTATVVPDTEAYEAAHAEWQAKYDAGVEVLEGLDRYLIDDVITYTDSDQAQWYINLWHRMNGASAYKVDIDGVDNGVKPDVNYLGMVEEEETYEGMSNNLIDGLTENGKVLWTVLEDGLMNSSEWLNYALSTGTVTLERVNFTDPTEDGSGLEYATWTSIIYSNATDITEQENETAIAKAEVKYEQALRDIESKDKQYDNMLKRLDTEHDALQTEYDSIKNVIGKNIERTLKLYS